MKGQIYAICNAPALRYIGSAVDVGCRFFLFVEPATRESRGFKKCRNPIEYAGGGEAKAGVTVLNVI